MALVTIVYSLLISVAMGSIYPGFCITIQICSSVIHKSVIFLFLFNFPTQKTLHDLRARFLSESGNCDRLAHKSSSEFFCFVFVFCFGSAISDRK